MSVTDEIKHKIDIVDLVSATVKLRRSGKAYAGFCPFHQNTRTPAFYVFPDTQSWHCFGACGSGGDIFTFVMKKENVDFSQALRMLAERAGVPLRREAGGDQDLQRLLEINQTTAAYYQYQLKNHPAAQSTREYLARRRINANSIQAFQIGFAPNTLNGLVEHLKLKGYTIAEMERAGVVFINDEGIVRDRFRNRIIFPIRNRRGQTIGFGARALSDEQQPKYLNSPDTPLFNKSDILYGIDFAKDAIRSENLAVIVEGYTDVIIAHQEGFKNVIASLGTALTEKQLGQLSRLTKRYALALDADAAGAAATARGLALARKALSYKNSPVPLGIGLIVFKERLDAELLILELPAGRDPDEIILANPRDWAERVSRAMPLLDYYFNLQSRDLDLQSAAGKSELVKRLVPIIAQVKDSVQRLHYAQQLARLVKSDERVILDQVKQLEKSDTPVRTNTVAREAPQFQSVSARYDEYLITLAMAQPELLAQVAFVSADDFDQVTMREIWLALQHYAQKAALFDLDEFLDSLTDAVRETGERLRNLAKRLEFSDGEAVREIQATAYRLRLQRYQNELTQLRHLLADSPLEEQQALAERVNQVRAWMAETRRALDARNLLKHSVSTRV